MSERLIMVATGRLEQRWLDRWAHDPTPDDLVAHLRAHPEALDAVLDALGEEAAAPVRRWLAHHSEAAAKVAGPWMDSRDFSRPERVRRAIGHHMQSWTPAIVWQDDEGRWHSCAHGCSFGPLDSCAQAEAAADGVMAEAGWVLGMPWTGGCRG